MFMQSFFHPMFWLIWMIVVGIIFYSNIVITRQFIMDMDEENCDCATDRGVFKLMNIINWLQIALTVVIVLVIVWLTVTRPKGHTKPSLITNTDVTRTDNGSKGKGKGKGSKGKKN